MYEDLSFKRHDISYTSLLRPNRLFDSDRTLSGSKQFERIKRHAVLVRHS